MSKHRSRQQQQQSNGMLTVAPETGATRQNMTRLELPLEDLVEGQYAQRHVEVMLSMNQAKAFKRLWMGLQRQGARLNNKRFVNTPPDVIRWLCEQIPTGERS